MVDVDVASGCLLAENVIGDLLSFAGLIVNS